MKEPVVVATSDEKGRFAAADNASGWKYLFLLGCGMLAVGIIDVGLLFIPPRWSSLDWEFGTIAGVFDGMPLMTIGIGTMSAAAVANGWRAARRVMVVLTLMLTVVIALLALVFALDVPVALRAVQPGMRGTIKLAALKTGLMSGTYFVLYLALGVWTWRRLKARP